MKEVEAALPQTDLSILCDVRMPYSGQTSHFRRLEINMERKARKGWDKFLFIQLFNSILNKLLITNIY